MSPYSSVVTPPSTPCGIAATSAPILGRQPEQHGEAGGDVVRSLPPDRDDEHDQQGDHGDERVGGEPLLRHVGEVEPDEHDDRSGDHRRQQRLDSLRAGDLHQRTDQRQQRPGGHDAAERGRDAPSALAASTGKRSASDDPRYDGTRLRVTARNTSVPIPEEKIVVLGGNPVRTGTRNVAPNIRHDGLETDADGVRPGQPLLRPGPPRPGGPSGRPRAACRSPRGSSRRS